MSELNVFITGATGGIGAAFARLYAGQGCKLGLTGRRQDALDRLVASLPGNGHRTYAVDVTDRDGIIAAAHQFEAEVGPADLVIACAGIDSGIMTIHYEDLAVMEKIFSVNVIGMANTFHGFLPSMAERRKGTLVGIASVGGIRGLPGSEGYCASKSAVITYCESLRIGMKKSGIDVLTICPGFIRTPLTAKNPYHMPFLMEADAFARKAADAIRAKRSYAVIPWQMGIVANILRLAPNCLLDRILMNRKHKPRADA